MSDYFKAGQKVRRIGEGTPFAVGTPQRIDVGDIRTIESVLVGTLGSGLVLEGIPGTTFDPEMFVVVEDEPTPAPLDPSKVKAGDTVTLESGTALVRDVVIEVKSRGVGQFVFYTGESPDPLIPGTYYLVNPGAWTLTDHQPAPEPEPKWDRAADYVATVRGVPGVRVTWSPVDESDRAPWRTRESVGDGKWSWHEEQYVADVRPLVVIDPAEVDVDALVQAYKDAWDASAAKAAGLYADHVPAGLRAVLAALGIEVAR